MNRLISAFVILIVLFTAFFENTLALPAQAVTTASEYCMTVPEKALVDLINQHRDSEELPPLIPSKALGAAARDKSLEMRDLSYTDIRGNTQIGYFDQVSPSGVDAVVNAANHDYYNGYIGQNILREETTAESAFQILRSDTQRDNMLNPNFIAFGIGYAEGSGPDGGEPTNLWTTIYGGQVLDDDIAAPCDPTQNTPTPIPNTPTPTPVTPTATPTVPPIPTQTPTIIPPTPTNTPTVIPTPPPVTPDPTLVPPTPTPTEVVPTPTEVVPTPTVITGEHDILCTGKVKADGSVVISCVSAPTPAE